MQNSLPLNRTCGLGGDVIENSVDSLDLACDSCADLVKNRVGNFLDGRGHSVLGVNGADDRGPALKAAVILDTYALYVGNNYKILPNLLCKTAIIKLLAQDRICLAERVKTVTGDSAETSYTESGSGEGLTVNHRVRETERLADYANLVLEKKLSF